MKTCEIDPDPVSVTWQFQDSAVHKLSSLVIVNNRFECAYCTVYGNC